MNNNVTQISKELRKWLSLSQKFRTSSIIIEAKVKGNLAHFESKASTADINSLQSQMGEIFF
jgi:hypothetical protein